MTTLGAGSPLLPDPNKMKDGEGIRKTAVPRGYKEKNADETIYNEMTAGWNWNSPTNRLSQ